MITEKKILPKRVGNFQAASCPVFRQCPQKSQFLKWDVTSFQEDRNLGDRESFVMNEYFKVYQIMNLLHTFGKYGHFQCSTCCDVISIQNQTQRFTLFVFVSLSLYHCITVCVCITVIHLSYGSCGGCGDSWISVILLVFLIINCLSHSSTCDQVPCHQCQSIQNTSCYLEFL